MSFVRQFLMPLLIVVVFLVALLAVSSRIFLPADMAAPAPVGEEVGAVQLPATSPANLSEAGPDSLSVLVEGLPDSSANPLPVPETSLN